ncbi:MAG: rRNA methyltransferase [Buchnera aphidicola (Pentalonia nigronervosa)]|jgi:23S rRNA (uridine2552-2'-O)-methyltransferase|uniref:Ribosomal RNA large subunit methyltransferase E n=1 Tax=Buchnera aphidicola (Pentalonia nigronervosa) TaxID=1309793 RepID=A0A7H1AZZ8_9GAMM|nr:MAG: rRNA methyltransferase [Buchnera aphidicola (Pentalonia nigronervosa)]
MILKRKSNSSSRWLFEHFQDKYVQDAKKNKVRSRSWFKLKELDDSYQLFRNNMNVIDLGSAPGGWTQYARNKIGLKGKILACDILPMLPITGVHFCQGDIRNKKTLRFILNYLKNIKIHLIISDIAPNITGNSAVDMPRIIELCKSVLKISRYILSRNGRFVLKSFHGEGFNAFYEEIKTFFSKVKICKPKSSRARSREIFILATR